MTRLSRLLLVFLPFCMLLAAGATLGLADTSLEETKKLLQKGLTLAQIDQEIARLTDQERTIAAQIEQAGVRIADQDKQVAATRDHAGKVLRAYYMGDRPSVWTLVFSAKSFADAISVYEYLSMMVDNDRRTLAAYLTSYRDLKELQAKLLATQQELQHVKAEFLAQRERAVALQKELDEQLALQPDAKSQIDKLTAEWREKGIPLFRKYFQAISEAMQSMPEVLQGPDATKYLNYNFSNGAITFKMTDRELLDFFRSKNKLFDQIDIRFANGRFQVKGEDSGTKMSIEGHYEVQQNPNRLKFIVDQLTYNELALDYTFNRALEEEFDLGFSPEKYMPGYEATSVSIDDGKLVINIKKANPPIQLNTPNKP